MSVRLLGIGYIHSVACSLRVHDAVKQKGSCTFSIRIHDMQDEENIITFQRRRKVCGKLLI